MTNYPESELGLTLPVPGTGQPWSTARYVENFQNLEVGVLQRQAKWWPDRAARLADTGGFDGVTGYQADTGESWQWTGSAWRLLVRPLTPAPGAAGAWTPMFTSGIVSGSPTKKGQYEVVYGRCRGWFGVTLSAGSEVNGNLQLSLPIAVDPVLAEFPDLLGSFAATDANVSGAAGRVVGHLRNSGPMFQYAASGSDYQNLGVGTPWSWQSGDQIFGSLDYKVDPALLLD